MHCQMTMHHDYQWSIATLQPTSPIIQCITIVSALRANQDYCVHLKPKTGDFQKPP